MRAPTVIGWFGVFVVALGFGSTVNAGTLFKCKDAKGVVSYQQTTCPEAKQDAGAVAYKPVKDAPGLSWSGQAEQKRLEQKSKADYIRQDQNNYATQTIQQPQMSSSTRNELIRRLEMASTKAERNAISAQLGIKPTAAQRAAPSPTPAPDLTPTTLRDQRGNSYTQPPGSVFVQDQRTGKQCILNGNVIVKCK